ncbi:MrcB family domain-containing protein [Halorussus aquaticus]|uniref:MrcB family domain-containing protein n=1 Tax=Halorussus aquaticus TaxID=2953748 RepID=A0ABD5Q8I5_9EURY|nr:DUF3578 domain-containing protein [Halorussus aquaticus]
MSLPSEGLSELLHRVVAEYPVEQIGQGLTSHVTRKDIETHIPEQIEEILGDEDVVVKSSPGRGRWTAIPWVAVMDPRETTEIQDGVYVVYLFEPQQDRVTLTLNQGVTTLKDELGTPAARNQLEETARDVRKTIQPKGFKAGSLEFPNASSRNELYGPGTIFYKRYQLGEIPDDDELERDLRTLVDGYQKYISVNSSPEPKSTPTVYQVPVKAGDGPIRTNFEQTIVEGVPRERLEGVYEAPIDQENLRVWGNQEDEAAEEGDYLLFADRNGRRDGDYTVLARVAHATVLDPNTAREFTDAVGWGDATDRTFPHVMFLEPIYQAKLDREWFWDLLDFKGWPNDTYSALNFDRDGSTFFSEFDSVEEFLE